MTLQVLAFNLSNIRWHAIMFPPWTPKGGNLTCSALWVALLTPGPDGQRIKVARDLHLQARLTFSECA